MKVREMSRHGSELRNKNLEEQKADAMAIRITAVTTIGGFTCQEFM
jgi:hypothetical protein